jgi:putative flippase GtrA
MLRQLIRFAGVGGLATVLHVAVALLVQHALPVSAQAANFAGFCAAVTLSYFGHARFTFQVGAQSGGQFLRFVATSLLGLATSSSTVWLITTKLGFSFWVAMVVVAAAVPLMTYIAMRYWVFLAKAEKRAPP